MTSPFGALNRTLACLLPTNLIFLPTPLYLSSLPEPKDYGRHTTEALLDSIVLHLLLGRDSLRVSNMIHYMATFLLPGNLYFDTLLRVL